MNPEKLNAHLGPHVVSLLFRRYVPCGGRMPRRRSAHHAGRRPVKQFKIDGLEAHSGETASVTVLGELRLALDEARLSRK